jgi:hypothetical protein
MDAIGHCKPLELSLLRINYSKGTFIQTTPFQHLGELHKPWYDLQH